MTVVDDWQLVLEEVPCDLCGSSDVDEVMWAEDRRYGNPGRFRVVRCRGCRLVYVSPRPAPASLGRYYPTSYRPHGDDAQHSDRLGARLRALAFGGPRTPLARAAEWLYNHVAFRAFVAADRPGRVLDIGCGPGDYLRVWKQLGWEVEGLEPSAAAAERARRALDAPVHVGFVEDVPLAAGRYDLITMSHSLEHTRSPRAVLGLLRPALAPGGRVLVMVPNFAAWDRVLFRDAWYGLEVPRHLYHYEPDTLRLLFDRAGYDVEALSGTAHPDAVTRSLRLVLGRDVDRVSRAERALAAALTLPLAAARRSTSLWALARPR